MYGNYIAETKPKDKDEVREVVFNFVCKQFPFSYVLIQ